MPTWTSCSPRYATERNEALPTLGVQARKAARALGRTPYPWQLDALDVAGEYDPDTGRMAHPLVVWVVPRRAGKSLAALVTIVGRVTGGRERACWYTAHRREVAAALWRDEWFPILGSSPLAPYMHLRRSNGSETITMPGTGSRCRLFAPSGESLRSQNADLVVVDEAREFTADQGAQLEAAVRPAQLTRPARQLWLISSAGRAHSSWLRAYRDRGRAGDPSIAYLEYAAPDDLPWDDPATWRLAHPTLGGPVEEDAIAADLSLGPVAFGAEYLGWWEDPAPIGDHPIPAAVWNPCGDTTAALAGAWHVAVDVDVDRSGAALAAATIDRDGVVTVELLALCAVDQVLATLAAAVARHPRATVSVDEYGPAGNLTADLTRAYRGRVRTYNAGDVARACATFQDRCHAGTLRHRHQLELTDAVTRSVSRPYGDAWLWRRRGVESPTSAVIAATLAVGTATTPPARVPAISR